MKKGLLISVILSAAAAVSGAITVGATFNQYNNFQNLQTIYNININTNGNKISLYTYIDAWNQKRNSYTDEQRNNLIEGQKNTRIAFYQNYPTYADFELAMKQTGLTDDEIKKAYESAIVSMSIDFNYDANQSGVIAGSTLLVLGLVTFVILLFILLKKKNNIKK